MWRRPLSAGLSLALWLSLAAPWAAAGDEASPLLAGVAAGDCEAGGSSEDLLGCLFKKWLPRPVRIPRGQGDATTGYGEITPAGIVTILEKVEAMGAPVGPEDTFADLGSGLGRVVLQMFLTTPVKRAVGVELMQLRYDAADSQLKQVKQTLDASPVLSKLVEGREAAFVHGSFLDSAPWSDATIVFTNAVLFDEPLMHGLRKAMLEELQPGALIFTLKPLPACRNDALHLVGHIEAAVSWQSDHGVKTFVYMKTARQTFKPGAVLVPATTPDAVYPIREGCPEEHLASGAAKLPGTARRLCSLQDPAESRQLMDARCAWKELEYLHKLDFLEESKRKLEVPQFLQEAPWQVARDFDRRQKQADGSILHHVARQSKEGLEIEALLEANCDPNMMDSEQITALHVANQPKVVTALIAAGANVSAVSKWGHTPLLSQVARTRGSASVVAALLEGRAELSLMDGAKRTPLHLAAKRADEDEAMDVVKVLLRAGADPHAIDLFDHMPVDYAVTSGLKELLAVRDTSSHGGEL